jgi:hypothetical protein
MAAMSDYLEQQLINHIFRTSSYSKPSTIAIGLWTNSLTDASDGSSSGEVTGASYTRTVLNPADANWANTSGGNGTTNNLSALTWNAGEDWGTITTIAVLDNSTLGAGNILFYGDLLAPRTILLGDTFQFDISGLLIQIDD